MRAGWTVLVALAACGGSHHAATPEEPHHDSLVGDDQAGPPDAGEDDGLELVSDRGHVDADFAAQQVAPHADALNACYVDRLARRKWLDGSVALTWKLAGDGALVAVNVVTSDLGAWPVEKCLISVARGISFGKPIGGKPAEVSFPITFSAGSMALMWSPDEGDRAVGKHLDELRGCAKAGGGEPTNVTVTIYVGTRGKVQSVGFSAPAGVTEAWADCAEAKVSAWTLPDPRGKVAKLSVTYHPAAMPDDDEDE